MLTDWGIPFVCEGRALVHGQVFLVFHGYPVYVEKV